MPPKYDPTHPTQAQRHPELARDEAWIRAFLHTSLVGHLAHNCGDQPFLTPLNFWFDEARQRLIFHSSLAGRLHDNLSHNPKVCLAVSATGRFLPANTALEFSLQYRSVQVFGTISLLENEAEKTEALEALLKKYFPKLSPGKEYRPITPQELARTAVYALEITSWSGKENWAEQAEQLSAWPPLPDEFLK